jgi:type 1 glutamine amidotransferase
MKAWFGLMLSVLTAAALTSSLAADRKLVMIAGKPSHGPGDHEFNAGVLLLKQCLEGCPGLKVSAYNQGWPNDPQAFKGADAVFLFSDGGGGHPYLEGNRLQIIGDLAKKGVGIGMAHFAVEVPKDKAGQEFQDWIGGYYEDHFSCNPMWSPDYRTFPEHPITRGVKPFSIKDEWYMHMRFRPNMEGITPLLVAKPSDAVRKGPYVYPPGPYDHIVAASGQDEIMMWCVQRPDGGRGFGFTGGHYQKNWGDENFRKIVLNALLWVSKLEVPADGVASTVTDADLKANLDPKGK